ncbi:hypothetical protein ElyMa_003544600 [Elysia marginata]|uniref:Uncharacterized protein n=1 Tax=Elysia marginata TaxID=1093978 RepID=A0AAV4EKC2_9GAST|nr:hypothetical protein ElyMa_003544600 [Elysia marginata]
MTDKSSLGLASCLASSGNTEDQQAQVGILGVYISSQKCSLPQVTFFRGTVPERHSLEVVQFPHCRRQTKGSNKTKKLEIHHSDCKDIPGAGFTTRFCCRLEMSQGTWRRRTKCWPGCLHLNCLYLSSK